MSIDRPLGIDVGIQKPSEFTKELLAKRELDAETAWEKIKNYSLLYHKCAEHVMNGELEKAQAIREELKASTTA